MEEFPRIQRLPPYVFAIVNELKYQARLRGEDIIDFGMGNPDGPTPQHIVDRLCEAAQDGANHGYSVSKGIKGLRQAIARRYKKQFDVELDPESEVIATIGTKEGLSHFMLATLGPGDSVLVPNPTYPIHTYGAVIAGADVRHVPMIPNDSDAFFEGLEQAVRDSWPRPKMLVLNFPHNPTAACVELPFFERVVDFAKEHKIIVVHDMAYADITFDGYKTPSFLQVKGAKDVGVEFYTMSKAYNMAGWRVGFMLGNERLVHALTRLKSYLDYGMFTPIQVAAAVALDSDESVVESIRQVYVERRKVLCEGLERAGWPIDWPKASMFVWARLPEQFRHLGSLEFTKQLLQEAHVAVAPGVGFGNLGDEYVRIAMIENEHRTRQAIRGIKKFLAKG